MVNHASLAQQQGQYRYNPSGLEKQGPARIFPYTGEDGVVYYILTKLRQDVLNRGQLSEPWSLLLQQIEKAIKNFDESWIQISTLLVDWEIFQSGWFNFSLPPNEQFDAAYVRYRRTMAQTLLAARKSAQSVSQQNLTDAAIKKQQRSQFYQELDKRSSATLVKYRGSAYPMASRIHEREGGLSDREFARQRLAGQNPMVLRRLGSQDKEILEAWSGQTYNLVDGSNLDLGQAVTAHRLFVADYPLLQNLSVADLQPGRYVGSPIALFYRSESGLEPLLIQVEKGTVVTPSKNWSAVDDWMRAKLYVQTADVTHHELIAHLCYTHLAMEGFAIATSRQLPENHPLYQLLHPHFQFLLAINTRGNTILLGEGAAIDKLMAPTREASLSLINQAYRKRPFLEYALPNDIKNRGIEPEFLPNFPYRDDALLLWFAIANYTARYLQRYYPDDTVVQQDQYLQAWATELSTPLVKSHPTTEFPQPPTWIPKEWVAQAGLEDHLPNYPRIPGFGEITSLQQLIDIATTIIFTCGPQHAAVNFSQFDYATYAPNAPLALYSRPDTPATLEELLPTVDQDLAQMELTYALSGIRYGQFGSSEMIQLVDKGDRQTLAQFQHELAEIEEKINARNQERLADSGVEYPYLLPSCIPNSINI